MRVPSACLTVSMCICRCGPKHKWKATARVFDYRFSQVECLKRYVAPRAIEADIFEISVCEPVVRRGVVGPIPQHQQESLSHRFVSRFGDCVDLCSAIWSVHSLPPVQMCPHWDLPSGSSWQFPAALCTASSAASAAASTFALPLVGTFSPPSADVSALGLAVGEFMAIPGCIVPGELRSSSIPGESPRKPNPERKGSKPAEKKNSGKTGSKKQTCVKPLKKQPDARKHGKRPNRKLGRRPNREEKKKLLPTKRGGNKTGNQRDLCGAG